MRLCKVSHCSYPNDDMQLALDHFQVNVKCKLLLTDSVVTCETHSGSASSRLTSSES